jgi:Fic family protein
VQFSESELHGRAKVNPDDFDTPETLKTGKLVPTIKGFAFLPDPLPPRRILDLAELVPALSRAERALGELSGVGRTLPNPYLLVRPFMRREAVASSKIEGTVTNLPQLLLFELDHDSNRAPSDAKEVWNYMRALEFALGQLDALPISGRLIKETHRILLRGVEIHRGARIVPGEYRSDQNWIGAGKIEYARFVPPPPQEVDNAMSNLEKYIHQDDDEVPLLIRLALIHYQFETIHPFPDGNGRVGRLLIPLILCARKEISQPLLYLSSFFERNYDDYVDHMLTVSTHGLWERWISFFLTAVEESCKEAIERARALQDLQERYRERVQRARSSALLGRLIDLLFEHPAITTRYAADRLKVTYNAAKNNIEHLVGDGILRAGSDEGRPKLFFADAIIEILS